MHGTESEPDRLRTEGRSGCSRSTRTATVPESDATRRHIYLCRRHLAIFLPQAEGEESNVRIVSSSVRESDGRVGCAVGSRSCSARRSRGSCSDSDRECVFNADRNDPPRCGRQTFLSDIEGRPGGGASSALGHSAQSAGRDPGAIPAVDSLPRSLVGYACHRCAVTGANRTDDRPGPCDVGFRLPPSGPSDRPRDSCDGQVVRRQRHQSGHGCTTRCCDRHRRQCRHAFAPRITMVHRCSRRSSGHAQQWFAEGIRGRSSLAGRAMGVSAG